MNSLSLPILTLIQYFLLLSLLLVSHSVTVGVSWCQCPKILVHILACLVLRKTATCNFFFIKIVMIWKISKTSALVDPRPALKRKKAYPQLWRKIQQKKGVAKRNKDWSVHGMTVTDFTKDLGILPHAPWKGPCAYYLSFYWIYIYIRR